MRAIMAELAGTAHVPDKGYEPITYRELARRAYGVADPTRWQREAVGRACRTLERQGQVETLRRQGEPRERRYRGRRSWWIAACRGGRLCDPCQYGNRSRPLDRRHAAQIRKAYGEEAADELKLAKRHGYHEGRDYTEEGPTLTHAVSPWEGAAALPPTEADLAARQARRAAFEAEMAELRDAWAG